MMCFDKTGTLTEDDLNLLGVRPVNDESGHPLFVDLVSNLRQTELSGIIIRDTKNNSIKKLIEVLASCHSLSKVNNELIGM